MLKTIHLVHHTHMDIGYTDLPREVMDQHLGHMDAALDLCERYAGSNTPFYWTCESALLVEDYLACRPAPQRERLLRALRDGWIELQALLTQPLTELPSGEELVQCAAYAAELGRKEGFSVECAMIDDIGGYAGRLPTILNGVGVRYLVAGVGGFQAHLAWADLPHVFYLEDKAGARLLVWNPGQDRDKTPQEMMSLDAVYGIGATYLVTPFKRELLRKDSRGVEVDLRSAPRPDADARAKFAELEQRLAKDGYPFEEIMLQYGGDNRGPDPDLPETISRLNALSGLPAVQLTTPRRFLRRVEAMCGAQIPVLRGVITDPWNMRANTTASALKMFRRAQRTLHAAEAWRALLPDERNTEAEEAVVSEAYRNLHFFGDHTCGLSEWHWQSAPDPKRGRRDAAFDRYRRSWAIKRSYAETALRQAERLARRARQRLAATIRHEGPAVLVWNPTTRAASGPAELYIGRDLPSVVAFVDPTTGEEIGSQCVGPNRHLLYARDVPPMGFRRFDAVPGDAPEPPGVNEELDSELENEFLKLRFDPGSGRLLSVLDKRTGRERLDRESGLGLGEFVYHQVRGVCPRAEHAGMNRLELERLPVQADRVVSGMSGPIARSVVSEGHVDGPAGAARVRSEVVLYGRLPRVDVRFRLDKPETEQKESCCIAFPFAGPQGTFRFDQNVGWVEPSADLLPAAMQDAFYCSSWTNVSTDEGSVTVAGPDAPVFQFGRIRTGEWEDALPFTPGGNHLYSWLHHNLLNTDCPIWQDVLDEFRFGVVFHDRGFTPESVLRAAAQMSHPLRAEFRAPNTYGTLGEASGSFLAIEPNSARMVSLRRVGANAIRVRLEETTGEATRAKLQCRSRVAGAFVEDPFGERLRAVESVDERTVEVALPANALVTVRIEPG